MQQIVVNVDSPGDILSGYGAGALLRVERDTTSTMSGASEITTIAVVDGKTQYEYWDATGGSTHYYRVRYSKASPSLGTDYSDYSAIFQAAPGPSYTNDGLIKARLNVTDTTDDVLFGILAEEVNGWLEGKIGFPVRPIASEARTFDGETVRWIYQHSGLWYAILPVYPWGVRTVSVVETADGTDASYATRTASDVVLRPHSRERTPGWPAFEIMVKESAGWTFPTYGLDTIRITATWGWDAIPVELKSIATRLAIAAYRARGAGSGRTFAVGEDINALAADELSAADWWTIDKYALLRAPVG